MMWYGFGKYLDLIRQRKGTQLHKALQIVAIYLLSQYLLGFLTAVRIFA